jgi:hypothetical protein
VATQRDKPRVPADDVAIAARDDRAQVVVDALARDAAEPLQRPDVPLQKRLRAQIETEVRRLRTRERQRREQRIDTPLAPGDLRPRRHLRPIELQHLPRPIARPLRRPRAARAQRGQAPLDQIYRSRVAVVRAQDLRHPWRLDLRPLLQQPPQHRFERIEHRPLRYPPIARRLVSLQQPPHRPPIDPQPRRDLPLRDPVRGQRPHLRPLHRAPHLLTLQSIDTSTLNGEHRHPSPRPRTVAHFSTTGSGALLGSRRHSPRRLPAGLVIELLADSCGRRPKVGRGRAGVHSWALPSKGSACARCRHTN